ncbi:zf-C3HC domain containing protein, partial [Naviculisporaceae sp. PSN 640]
MNATVKRKFNALLQGIGTNNSSTATSSSISPGSNKRPSSAAGLDDDDDDGAADDANANGVNRSSSISSSPSATRIMDSTDLLNKKRRVGAGAGASASQPILVGASTPTRYGSSPSQTPPLRGTTTISNITLRKWTPSGTPGGEGPQKYCPGDRDQLIRRLGTFQELTEWAPKPDAVNEIEWAKRGWVCHGKERVKCTLCSREIVVKINRKEVDGREIAVMIASEIAQSVVDMYKDMIVTSHAEDCLWRRRGCDDSLLRLPLPNSKWALEALRQRYDELLERKDFLPEEPSIRLPETLNLDVVLTYLPPNFFTTPPPARSNPPTTPKPSSTDQSTIPAPPTGKPNRVALALALTGWQGLSDARIGHAANSSSCHTCLRRLGLWMFKPKAIDNQTGMVVPAVMDHLDPLREHRFFCPWKNGTAQRNSGAKPNREGGGDKPAWEILIQGLRNEAFIRQRTSVVHSRSKSTVDGPVTTGPGTPARRGGDGSANPLKTPERERRPMTSDGRAANANLSMTPQSELLRSQVCGDDGEEDDEETKKKKDHDMMSRLRRVKSLFNAKAAGSKLKKLGSSRPGTSHSTATNATAGGASRPGTSKGGG